MLVQLLFLVCYLDVILDCIALLVSIAFSQAMDVDAKCLGVADCKGFSQRWLKRKWSSVVGHIFADNQAFLDGHGKCVLHGKDCKVSMERPDLVTGGLPCPAFSRLRDRTKSHNRGKPWEHDSFHVTMVQFPEYLSVRRPRGFWIEQVETFGAVDKSSNRSFLHEFMRNCCSHGYAVRALVLPHDAWIDLPRTRIYVIGCHHDMGHKKAVEWIVEQIQSTSQYRALTPPTAILDLIDVEAPSERARCDHDKVLSSRALQESY